MVCLHLAMLLLDHLAGGESIDRTMRLATPVAKIPRPRTSVCCSWYRQASVPIPWRRAGHCRSAEAEAKREAQARVDAALQATVPRASPEQWAVCPFSLE